jgi:hypothetical protein
MNAFAPQHSRIFKEVWEKCFTFVFRNLTAIALDDHGSETLETIPLHSEKYCSPTGNHQ